MAQYRQRGCPHTDIFFSNSRKEHVGAIMKKKKRADSFPAYVSGIGAICVVAGFLAVWGYIKMGQVPRASVAYAQIGPLHVDSGQYTFMARLALQTGSDDARWAGSNLATFQRMLHRALQDADPASLRTPDGLRAMQQRLTLAVNREFAQPRVQQVLFTDFIIQTDPYAR
jgi:flagellar basal body-associated protein FliL